MILTTKQELFIRRMTENQEQAKWGFEILLKRQDFADFFDNLLDAKLFLAENNIGPVPADEPGYVQIPYWSALDYLEAVAKHSADKKDILLARKVLDVIYSVSSFRDPDGSIRDNYHTYRKFAEIIGIVPTSIITTKDLDLIPVWLNSKFNCGLVVHALDNGALRVLLDSDSPEDWEKACIILYHCTAIRRVEDQGFGSARKKTMTVADDYWLYQLVKKYASEFGIKAGEKSTHIFRDRVREIYGENDNGLPTYLSRPAVEDHPQNHSWDRSINCIVEGFRDVLLAWIDKEPVNAKELVKEILIDNNEMVRRIGIYVLGQRWPVLKDLYSNVIAPQLFNSRHIHELYHLLKDNFLDFSDFDKSATIEAIRQLPIVRTGEDAEQFLRVTQRNWLSAIVDKGYPPADIWFADLMSDETLGPQSKHPDFHYYMETWWGPGPSPYSVQELLVFAEDGSLVERLNNFKQMDAWRGPSTRALVKSLEEAVVATPMRFIRLLSVFLDAKRPFQYGVINGFKSLWEAPKEKQSDFDWSVGWEKLIDFFEMLLCNPGFWCEEVFNSHDLTPTRNWIPPMIADFLRVGTRDDNHAYSSDLLNRTLSLLQVLLERTEAVDEVSDDAMMQADNSSKGKVIAALFEHTLRMCRVSDKERGDHIDVWISIKPTFDAELLKCNNANFQFSTLAGTYLSNLEYISCDWLRDNITKIFPTEYSANFLCAVDGLTYSSATRSIYLMLLEKNILDRALKMDLKGPHTRERLIELIALAYLWGEEDLNSSRFSYIFNIERLDDLENISRFFWSIDGQELTDEQMERILCFWEKCVIWADTLSDPPKSLLSGLGRLICYVTTISDREARLLLAVAPYVNINYNTDNLIEGLNRLVNKDPQHVNIVLKKLLESYEPVHDYENQLKELLVKLAENGKRDDALIYIDRLRRIPGMDQLFNQLTCVDREIAGIAVETHSPCTTPTSESEPNLE